MRKFFAGFARDSWGDAARRPLHRCRTPRRVGVVALLVVSGYGLNRRRRRRACGRRDVSASGATSRSGRTSTSRSRCFRRSSRPSCLGRLPRWPCSVLRRSYLLPLAGWVCHVGNRALTGAWRPALSADRRPLGRRDGADRRCCHRRGPGCGSRRYCVCCLDLLLARKRQLEDRRLRLPSGYRRVRAFLQLGGRDPCALVPELSPWTLPLFFGPALAAQRFFLLYQEERRLSRGSPGRERPAARRQPFVRQRPVRRSTRETGIRLAIPPPWRSMPRISRSGCLSTRNR